MTRPWYTSRKYELVSMVAHKSLEHVQHCDLSPHTRHSGRELSFIIRSSSFCFESLFGGVMSFHTL